MIYLFFLFFLHFESKRESKEIIADVENNVVGDSTPFGYT